MNTAKPTKISCIVACYKDAQAIPHMARRVAQTMRRVDCDYECIFVNDCSPDDSQQVLEDLARLNLQGRGVLTP